MLDKTDEFYLQRLMWEDGVWAQQIAPDFAFIEGKNYLRLDGKIVKIIRGASGSKGYETVQGDDGGDCLPQSYEIYKNGKIEIHHSTANELGFRYQRSTSQEGLGRCTGSSWDNSRNLIPIYFPFLNEKAQGIL